MTVRLHSQDSVKLLSVIAHVNAPAGVRSRRNPEKPVQSHNMVDAEDVRVLEVMPQVSDDVAVALLSDFFRVERGEIPVLPAGKNGIRRCPSGRPDSEDVTVLPNIKAVGVDAQGQVEIHLHSFFTGIRGRGW